VKRLMLYRRCGFARASWLLMSLAYLIGCQTVRAVPVPTSSASTTASASALATPEVQIKVVPDTPPQVSIEITTATPASQHSLDTVFAYLHALSAGDAPYLLDSYATASGFDDGDTAWTYDNSLAILALLARGKATRGRMSIGAARRPATWPGQCWPWCAPPSG
jgi:hypothetical protein